MTDKFLTPEHRAEIAKWLIGRVFDNEMEDIAKLLASHEAADFHLSRLAYLLGEAFKAVMHVSGPSHPLALEIRDELAAVSEIVRVQG